MRRNDGVTMRMHKAVRCYFFGGRIQVSMSNASKRDSSRVEKAIEITSNITYFVFKNLQITHLKSLIYEL